MFSVSHFGAMKCWFMSLNEVACKGVCLMVWCFCLDAVFRKLLSDMSGLLLKRICRFQVWKMSLKYWFLIYLAHLKKKKKLSFLGILPGITTCYQQIIDWKKGKETLKYAKHEKTDICTKTYIYSKFYWENWTLMVTQNIQVCCSFPQSNMLDFEMNSCAI